MANKSRNKKSEVAANNPYRTQVQKHIDLISDNLKSTREKLGLSIDSVSVKTGLSKSIISDCEDHKRIIRTDTFITLALRYDVDLNSLTGIHKKSKTQYSTDDIKRWNSLGSTIDDMIRKLYLDDKTLLSSVLSVFTRKIYLSRDTIQLLVTDAQHNYDIDTAGIIRSLYESMIQGLYVISKKEKAEERAKLYGDYSIVEKYKFYMMIKEIHDSDANELTRYLYSTPGWAKLQSNAKNKYDDIKHKYLNPNSKRKNKVRNKWYEGNLYDIADDVGFKNECRIIQSDSSRFVHSNPSSVLSSPFVTSVGVLTLSALLMIRYLGRILKFYDISMSEKESGLFNLSNQDMFTINPDSLTLDL